MNGNSPCTSVSGALNFFASVCYTDSNQTPGGTAAADQACDDAYCSQYYDSTDVLVSGTDAMTDCRNGTRSTANEVAPVGVCGLVVNPPNGETARANCVRIGRLCAGSSSTCGTLNPPITETEDTTCFDPTSITAEFACHNNGMSVGNDAKLYDEYIRFSGSKVTLNAPGCPPTSPSPIMMGLASSTFSATMNGATTPLTTRGGFASMDWGCDESEKCHPLTIGKLRLIMNDATINGLTFKNTVIELKGPVGIDGTGPTLKIRAGTMKLGVTTTTSLGTTTFVASPNADIGVGSTPNTSLQINGVFGGLVPTTGHRVIPVNISLAVTTNTTSPGSQCASFTAFQQLTGFENVASWTTSPGSLSANPTLKTQGCFGLSVNGSNFRTLISAPFATPVAGGKTRLLLDVYVPPNQPNPFFLGAVQTLMSCPVLGINNVFLGQVELTGKPVGVFSTLSYNVPANIQAALAGSGNSCYFTVGVNTNATPTPIVLDNLRFSP